MKPMVLIASALLAAFLSGCSGNTMFSGAINSSPRGSMAGSFGMTGTSQTTSQTYLIGGIFQTDASGNVTGTARVDRSACFDFGTPLTFSGMINSQSQLTLTSSAFNGEVITITATISSDGQTISGGTFSISGGCASGDHGTASGFHVQGMAGSYSGTFMISGHPVTITATITNESGGNTGSSMLTGPVTFTVNGAICDLPNSTVVAGVQAGNIVHIVITNTLGGTATFAGAASDGTAKTVNGSIDLTAACQGTVPSLTMAQ